MNKTNPKSIDKIADRLQKIDIVLKNHLINEDQLLKPEIDINQIEMMFFQLYNDQKLDSMQTRFLLEILSPIYATKEYHKRLIEQSRRSMEITLKSINNYSYKKQKTEKEIKRIRRNLNKCWNAVQKTDFKVATY